MYAQVKKSNESKSRAVAHSVAQKEQQNKAEYAFKTKKPEILQKERFVDSRETKIIQREVPKENGQNPHPKPEAGSYVAASGKNEKYDSKNYPRSRFSFGKNTRNEVLSKYPNSKIGNRIVAVQDSASGQMVNVEGIQLDHTFSWDTISKIMDNDKNYTFYEAKMYYNDQTNLHPVLGGLNASAGSSGVHKMEIRYPEINEKIANIQTSWMNLQNYIVAICEVIGPIDPNKLLEYLSGIEKKLDEGLEY